ncbi:MAG: glycosyltransferase family 39 protein [Pirellulales bacterium]|nr:glycosyltransferase family 39 protein [Pirellulales bacterium]
MKRATSRERRAGAGDGSRAGSGQGDDGAPTTLTAGVGVWIFLACTALYLLAFYGVELPELSAQTGTPWQRYQFLQLLLVPELWWGSWLGEEGAWRLADRVSVLSLALSIWLVAGAVGWLALRAVRMAARLDALELAVYSLGVGASLVSLYTLCVGLAGGLAARGLLFVAPAVAVVLAAAVVAWRQGRASTDRQPVSRTSWPRARWLWCAVPFVGVIVWGGMLPPVEFDVREYHLEAVKEFYLSQRVSFLPHNVYANMPLGSEMLALVGMVVTDDWYQGGLVGKTAIALYTPLTALALVALGRRWFSTGAGIVAALVFLSTPWIALVSTSGLIEGASAFFWLLAIDATLRWRQARAESQPGAEVSCWILLAGFLAGSAVAVKYPAMLFVVAPLTVWIVLAERARCWRPLLLFALAAAVACGPWLAKNWVLAGNPTYPLLYRVFGGATRTEDKDRQWSEAHDPPNFAPNDVVARAGDLALRSTWLSPLVLPLVVAALVWRRREWPVAPLAMYLAFVLAAWWLWTHRIDRFWLPALPVAALLAGAGGTWNGSVLWRRSIALLLAMGLVANFVVITSGACGDNRYFAPLAELRVDPQRVPPWIAYVNEQRQPGQGVLSVGDAAVFDLAPSVVYNTAFDDNAWETLARAAYESRSEEELERLHKELAAKFAFIYVNWNEIARYRSPGNYGYSEFVEPAVFEFLIARGILGTPVKEFSESGVGIYPVRPLPGERRKGATSR